MTENTINFFNGGSAEPANMVMRISKEGIWVDPDLPTTEAADAVLRALDGSIKFLVNKAIEEEREACAKYVEECCLPDSYSEACLPDIANELRARG